MKSIKSRIKRVLILEIEEDSPEYDILYRLVHLSREAMKKLGFSEAEYRASSFLQSEILKSKRQ